MGKQAIESGADRPVHYIELSLISPLIVTVTITLIDVIYLRCLISNKERKKRKKKRRKSLQKSAILLFDCPLYLIFND